MSESYGYGGYLMGTNFFDEEDDFHPIFHLNRKSRKHQLTQIVIQSFRLLAKGPVTKSELQKLVKIRKKTLLPILKHLVEIGYVVRTGVGAKGSPYKYHLAAHCR